MEERLQVGKATRSTPRIHPSLRALQLSVMIFTLVSQFHIYLLCLDAQKLAKHHSYN